MLHNIENSIKKTAKINYVTKFFECLKQMFQFQNTKFVLLFFSSHNKNSLISFFLYLTCGLKMGDFRCFFLLLFTQSFLLWKSLFFVLLSIYIEIYIKLYLKIMCGKFIGWFYYECCYWLKGSECNIGSKRTHFCILFLFWCKIKTFLWALKERNWFLNMY